MSGRREVPRGGIAGTLLGALAIAVAYGAAFFPGALSLAPWLMAGGITVLIVSLLWLGAGRGLPGRRTPVLLLAAIGGVAVLLGSGLAAALLHGAPGPGAPLLLGLPRGAAMLLYGIGLAPALILPAGYALTFEWSGLSRARLEELRERLARLRDPAPPAE